MIFCFLKIVLFYGVSLILKSQRSMAIIHCTLYFFPEMRRRFDRTWRQMEGEFLNNTCNVWLKLCIK